MPEGLIEAAYPMSINGLPEFYDIVDEARISSFTRRRSGDGASSSSARPFGPSTTALSPRSEDHNRPA
jgi:hypothetical protein